MVRVGAAKPLGEFLGVIPRDQVWQNERLFADIESVAAAKARLRGEALSSLRNDPLDAMALRQFAYAANGSTDLVSQKALELAERVSRRDILTQLALIDVEVEAGRADRAMMHYDRALLVHPQVAETLFPVLAAAANDSEIRNELGVYATRPWFRAFLLGALQLGASTETIAQLLTQLGSQPGDAADRALRNQIADEFVARGAVAEAALLVAARLPRADERLRDVAFTEANLDSALGPFAWRLGFDAAAQAYSVNPRQIGAEIVAGRSGLVAERITLLPAQNFVRHLRVMADGGGQSARVTVTVSCLETTNGAKLARPLQSLTITPAPDPAELTFVVPAGCPAQRWRIMGYADFGASPTTLRLEWSDQSPATGSAR